MNVRSLFFDVRVGDHGHAELEMLPLQVLSNFVDHSDRARGLIVSVVHAIDEVIRLVLKQILDFADGQGERILVAGARGFHLDEFDSIVVGLEGQTDVVGPTGFARFVQPFDGLAAMLLFEILVH